MEFLFTSITIHAACLNFHLRGETGVACDGVKAPTARFVRAALLDNIGDSIGNVIQGVPRVCGGGIIADTSFCGARNQPNDSTIWQMESLRVERVDKIVGSDNVS